jgi:opacity protein-like surface antigen
MFLRALAQELLDTPGITGVQGARKEHHMRSMSWERVTMAALAACLWPAVPIVHAQSRTGASPWSVEAAVGWDNGIGGNINSSAIGTLDGEVVVIRANSFEDVYGTGLHLRFGGAYALSEAMEVTGTFTFQSLDADQVTLMGDLGTSTLYGRYTDYQTFALDVGLRRYLDLNPTWRAYGEGTLGLGFVDKTDITLVAPGLDLIRDANDFYDQTTAFALGANAGLMYRVGDHLGLFGQIGLRWMSGMTDVDDLVGTGLDDINDKSSRWTMPLVGGVRYRF